MTLPTDPPTEFDEIPSTLPPDIPVVVRDFENGEGAQALGRGVMTVMREVGRDIDLSSLDGITVAIDYDAALNAVDRGVEGLRPDGRTNDEDLVGVARAVLVRRENLIRTHLVFYAGPIACLALEEPEPEEMRFAIGLIAHECAHVEEHAWRDRQFPDTLLQREFEGFIPAYLQQFSEAFWCEYAVCRRSAGYARSHTAGFRDALSVRLDLAHEHGRDAIKRYRTHADLMKLFHEVANAVLEPLRMAAYLFGHLDGLASLAGDALPEVDSELPTDDEVFVDDIVRLVSQLRSLWDRRGKWEHHDDMLVLGETAFDVLRACGVDVQPRPDGQAYIHVPFTFDTWPDDDPID